MGISGFSNWIKERYWGDLSESVSFTEIPEDITFGHYLIDFNNVLHEFRIEIEDFSEEQKNVLSSMTDEEKDNYVIEQVILKTQVMYENFLPRFTFGLFMDGVVSMQKVNLKREVAHLHNFFNYTLKNRVYDPTTEQNYNPLQGISHLNAGTPFMDKLELKLRERFNGPNVFISGSREPGEGEHKIIEYISRLQDSENIMIYGNDSDLVILSMLLEKRIFVRRSEETGNIYIDVNRLSRDIYSWVNGRIIEVRKKLEFRRFIYDFVFLTFFVGNDYIPALKTRKNWNSMKKLLSDYISIITYGKRIYYFVDYQNKFKINTVFLRSFLYKISKKEAENLQYYSEKRLQLQVPTDKTEEQLVVWRRDHILYNPEYRDYLVPIDYSLNGWRQRYNLLMYGNIDPSDVCFSYFQSLYFCFELYFNKNLNWNFFTRIHDCPLSSDLLSYLDNVPDINTIPLPPTGEPVDVLVQRLLIVPRECFEYLPRPFAEILREREYDEFYPNGDLLPKIIWERESIYSIAVILPRMNVEFFKNFYEENKHLIN